MSEEAPTPDLVESLRDMYAAFNAREMDRVLGYLAADVDWPNAWEGGRVHRPEGVRNYWARQWATIDPAVEPVSFRTRPDGNVEVEVDQIARTLDGALLGQGRVLHVYTFRDRLIPRMNVEERG
jgi:SnoaL-like domain